MRTRDDDANPSEHRAPGPSSPGAPYLIVELPQGGSEWLVWRSQGIGASDAPAIMGENPWKTRGRMLSEKSMGWSAPMNEAMARGMRLEPEARRSYERAVGVEVRPLCLQSTLFDWLRASVDGLSLDGSKVVEIKCGESVYRQTASTHRVPAYYFGQLQHILAVTGLASIDFWCYLPRRPHVRLTVDRDDRYIERLFEAEEAFWQDVLDQRE